jgi:hypothetical protein
VDGGINHPGSHEDTDVGEGRNHFSTLHHDLGYPAIRRDVKSLCGLLRIRVTWFLFMVELRKVMDIELAIGNVFDNLLVNPGPAGENIWVWFCSKASNQSMNYVNVS